MIVIESPPWGYTRYRGLERRSLPQSTGWAQFTRRREVVCGVNRVRRADTVQIFSAFGIKMVELPLAALALARIEEARKKAARKAYAKRNARREAVRGVEHDTFFVAIQQIFFWIYMKL